jgi:hypothetical protein
MSQNRLAPFHLHSGGTDSSVRGESWRNAPPERPVNQHDKTPEEIHEASSVRLHIG